MRLGFQKKKIWGHPIAYYDKMQGGALLENGCRATQNGRRIYTEFEFSEKDEEMDWFQCIDASKIYFFFNFQIKKVSMASVACIVPYLVKF